MKTLKEFGTGTGWVAEHKHGVHFGLGSIRPVGFTNDDLLVFDSPVEAQGYINSNGKSEHYHPVCHAWGDDKGLTEVIVNGRSVFVTSPISYSYACALGRKDVSSAPTITWRSNDRGGSLLPDSEPLAVAAGMVINVANTGNA